MTELETYIQTYFGISNERLGLMNQLFQVEKLEKDDFYAKEGKHAMKLSFVKSGFLRVYRSTEEKEVTQWIISPGEFSADLSSLVFNTPARWNIQALSECMLYTISDENYRKIPTLIPQWDKLEGLFISKCFLTLENRVFSFLSMSAEERSQQLFAYNSQLFNQVPLQYIASMLGMTPETLSRIRNKMIS